MAFRNFRETGSRLVSNPKWRLRDKDLSHPFGLLAHSLEQRQVIYSTSQGFNAQPGQSFSVFVWAHYFNKS